MKAVLNLMLGAALILPGGCIQRTIGANDFSFRMNRISPPKRKMS